MNIFFMIKNYISFFEMSHYQNILILRNNENQYKHIPTILITVCSKLLP